MLSLLLESDSGARCCQAPCLLVPAVELICGSDVPPLLYLDIGWPGKTCSSDSDAAVPILLLLPYFVYLEVTIEVLLYFRALSQPRMRGVFRDAFRAADSRRLPAFNFCESPPV
jgi:hypothetical protein